MSGQLASTVSQTVKPRHGYVPKVLSTPFRGQVITLSALHAAEGEQGPNLLCPVRAWSMYLERSNVQTVRAAFCLLLKAALKG